MNVRNWKFRGWIRDLVVVGAVVLAIRAYQQRDLPGGAAPALSGIALDGERVSLEMYRGRPVLVHFWATWCGVCRAEQGSIDSIARELPVLSIASRSGSPREVETYVAQHGVAARVLVDASSALAKRYGIRSYPTSFVLDGDGEIAFREVGYTTELGLRMRLWLAGLGG